MTGPAQFTISEVAVDWQRANGAAVCTSVASNSVKYVALISAM